MRVSRWLLLSVTLLVSLGSISGQSFDLAASRLPIASTDGLWRFHPGDNSAWAAPDFDDSGWPLLRSDTPWTAQGYPKLTGYAWYRFQVRVPAGSPPLSLLLPSINTGYQVNVEGQPAGDWGGAQAHLLFPAPALEFFPLTTQAVQSAGTLHIAIRVWHLPIWAAYAQGGPQAGGALVGATELIQERFRVQRTALRAENVDLYVDSVLRAIIGLIILGLFALRRSEREYLWFAMIQLFGGADDVLTFLINTHSPVPIPIYDLMDASLAAAFWISSLFFFATLFQARRRLWFRVALTLAVVSVPAAPACWLGLLSIPEAGLLQGILVIPSLVWVLAILFKRAISRDRDACLLLFPVMLVNGFYVAFTVTGALNQSGWWTGAPDLVNLRVRAYPFDIGLYTIFNIFFLVALLAFLIRRFSLARGQEEELNAQMEAARQIQQMLVPSAAASVPGFKVEAVYLPAETVGGDFFQQVEDGEGGLLLVVGDVAGKGLPAAMMVSMLVGAVRTELRHTASPAELLTALNERMLDQSQGGFATCLIARISCSGWVEISNAGHLPPWRGGTPIELDGSLPLGIAAEAVFSRCAFTLSPGEQLTLVSDGVIEAQSASGELFGFERTDAVSALSADEIAQAAATFGQQDDITVVTVSLAGNPAAAIAVL